MSVGKKGFALNPTIVRVGLISFFGDLSSELLYPITPIFLTAILGASMVSVGVIEGCAELTASLLKVYAGSLSDRFRRRTPFIWSGYLVSALSKASIGLATGWGGVLVSRAMDRVGKGLRTAPRDALITDAVPKEQLGVAFGVHRAMDTFGAFLGPLVALFLLSFWSGQLRRFYFASIIPGLIAVGIAMTLPEALSKKRAREVAPPRKPFRNLPRPFFIFSGTWSIFSLANSSDAFLILRTKMSGVSLSMTIVLYCFYNLVYSVSSPFFGKWSDQVGKKVILRISLLLFSGVYLGFGFATEIGHYWLLFGLYGLFMGMSEGVGKALVSELVPGDLTATAQGFFGMLTGVSVLIASVVAGVLWDHVGMHAPFIYGGCAALVAFLISLKAI